MCRDIGITSCCSDEHGTGLCDVHFRDHQDNRCSCNISCHLRHDCCDDAEAIGCIRKLNQLKWQYSFNIHMSYTNYNFLAQTCTEAGKIPGGCMWFTSSCYVPGGNCYCDSYCTYFNDCCDDVSGSMTNEYGECYIHLHSNMLFNSMCKVLCN